MEVSYSSVALHTVLCCGDAAYCECPTSVDSLAVGQCSMVQTHV